ncbi:MAG: ABC transporter permease [Chloroflexi bacterium]|nr:ABC transporter permease [Chloroflexota bacterium]
MEIHTRWRKILKDIWGNKSRSILVILSIAIGIAAVGMINNGWRMIERDLFGTYPEGNPAHLHIYVSPFQLDLARAVEAMREVDTVQARRVESAQIGTADRDLETLDLTVVEDFEDFTVSRLGIEAGTGVPGLREILLERDTADALGAGVGDTVQVEVDDLVYALRVAGVVHDVHIPPYTITGIHTAFLSMETLNWMGEPAYYNRLDIVVADEDFNRESVLDTGGIIRDRTIEPAGYQVGSVQIPGFDADPGEYWAQNQMDGFILILQVMSVLAIFLSGGLVINTISAMLNQQIQQIGIMRAVGAVRGQLVQMYLANVVVFSVVALVVAIPLGLVGSWGLSGIAASFLNYNIGTINLSWQIVLLMAAIGLLMPVLVAMYPIVAGTRISVYDAIYQNGISGEGKRGLIERALLGIKALSPPVMLSLRNTFRKKARLAFTLITLTMAGAMFVSVFSTRASLTSAVDEIRRYFNYDAALSIPGGASFPTVEREAMRVEGVTVAEGWATVTGVLDVEGSEEGEELAIFATPAEDIVTVEPLLLEGRWIRSDDTSQVVINEDLLIRDPSIELGDVITVAVNGRDREFEVAGITSRHLIGPRIYVSYPTFNRISGQQNQVNTVYVRTDREAVGSPAVQDAVAAELEERFDTAGLSDRPSQTQHSAFAQFGNSFDIIVIVLIIMAGLLAVVGGLSLTGTMGMNVFERTREIGVLRAVGASNGAIRQVVIIEGVVVGLISWVLAAGLSYPVGLVLAGAVVRIVMETDLVYEYSVMGLLVWLAIVVVIGIISSWAPARRAELLTVREVLDYE